ncbi:putative holin-like toxin [Enterococcus ureasiticus]|uniref:Putative holin-like toxin n=1 Tax=Enterococcus ureasiticus TaxID=903984 RepID=A0A1E5GH22_9ENTE|nr:putative holin-like toxin [Enterococcus ureasiticus]OEG12026.1 putative holin-like toxin [Enterococcus ureasiticus]
MEGESLLSALETIKLILSFGMFTITLIKLIVALLKDKKK